MKRKITKESTTEEAAKEEEEQEEEEQEEEQEGQELEVEFDLFNQTESDKAALVALLRSLLAGPDDDVDGLAEAVVAADVGSVVKSAGYTDALGVITIVDMAVTKPWATQLARIAGIIDERADAREGLGLIVNERIVNMPTLRLAPAMHRSLFSELAERGPGAKQFERFLIIAPFFDLGQEGATNEAAKPLKRGKSCEFLRPEEEVFVEAADQTARIYLPTVGSAPRESSDAPVMRAALAAVVDARRIPEILTKIEKLFC